MRRFRTLALSLPLLATLTAVGVPTPGERWWHHVEVLADDSMEGRLTGSAGHRRAADYVIQQFRAAGLQPAGTDGFFQPITFVEDTLVPDRTHADLVAGDTSTPLPFPDLVTLGFRNGPVDADVDAPLVFIGYGLRIPEAGHDDFAGVDLKGKIAVVVSGGPAEISGAMKSAARNDRARELARAGAVGLISVTTPGQVEIPWSRGHLLALQPSMYYADAAMRDTAAPLFSASIDPARAALLFAASGQSFAAIAALADASRPLQGFDMKARLRAHVAYARRMVPSFNVVAKLPGTDPKLAAESVVVSAHLDHLGIGAPDATGDRLYNGAMDNASGVAALIEIARSYHDQGIRPRRSIVFLAPTAEEKGLLGSRWFALRPTPAAGKVVADFNFDMPLPLWPLKSILVLGEGESSLGADARAISAQQGIPLVPDPLPDRNAFIRSDQFSFIHAGIPAVAFKFGFAKGTPEYRIEHDWRANRYHAPSDDLQQQPVDKEAMARLDGFVAALALRVANEEAAPSWNADSFFRPKGR